MKKDIEWLREEVYELYPNSYSAHAVNGMLLKAEMVDKIIGLIDQLDKPEKPVVPQFVADWVESRDYCNVYMVLQDLSAPGSPHASKDVRNWIFRNQENVEKFVRAWLDGYEVEKEKRYYIVEKINNSTLMTFELSDVVGEEIIEFVDGYSENETIHFNSKEKAELIAHFVGESLEVEEVTE